MSPNRLPEYGAIEKILSTVGDEEILHLDHIADLGNRVAMVGNVKEMRTFLEKNMQKTDLVTLFAAIPILIGMTQNIAGNTS